MVEIMKMTEIIIMLIEVEFYSFFVPRLFVFCAD